MNIITLFCNIDDFFLAYEKWQAMHCLPKEIPPEMRGHPRKLHPSEVMTLLIAFHQSGYRTLKYFIQDFDKTINLKADFARAYYNRALAKEKLGQKDSAKADLEKAKKLDSNVER